MKKNKMSLTTELDLTREGTAEMTRWCILIALHQSFGIGAARLNKVLARAEKLGQESLDVAMTVNDRGMPSTDRSLALRRSWMPRNKARHERRTQMKIHMNLQLFAQPANHTGATGMSAEMKTYYEKRLLDQAEPLLVHDQFGDKYPIPANNGKTIEFRKYESLPKATEPLTEGVTPNAQALTVTPMTATVKQYGGWAAITDVLQLTAIDNNITQATKVLASQAGRTLDTVTREVLAGGTNVIYAPAGDTAVTSRANLTTASVLTPDLIDQAATALKAQNADAIGESYVAIVHPYVAYDLRRNPEWIDVHKYAAPENIYNGEIGKLAGVRFIETSEAKIWTGSGCPSGLAVFGTLVLAAHAYAVTEVEGGGLQHIVKQLGAGEDPLNQRASVGWKAIKTAERLCEQYMVRIESISPKYSAKAKAN